MINNEICKRTIYMFKYDAPNPYSNKSFFSHFTPSSQSIGNLVLPAQWRETKILNATTLDRFANQYSLSIQSGFIGTHDNAVLETVELKPNQEIEKSAHEQSYIIKFNGNGMLYQDALREFSCDANKLKTTVIGFNYRGVGNSTKIPSTFNDLITDGIAQVQRLLDKGIDSKRITLDGLSLGGGVATMVASHFHNIGKPIYLWNDRSFASISKAAAGMVAPETTTIFNENLAVSFETSSWSLMMPAGWDVDVAKAYNAIPSEYKSHMYVAKKSDNSTGDGVIAYRASLHKGVSECEKKRGMATGHKVYAKGGLFGGHNMSRGELISAEDASLSGQDQFEKFIKNQKR
jgi:pimeloyl-ACP methyl ester carboxylesterase